MTTAVADIKEQQRGTWTEVVRLANRAGLTAGQVADLIVFGIGGDGLPHPWPEPTIPELTQDQLRAVIYRAAIRSLVGEPPGEDDLEYLLLTSFEALLMSERAAQENLPHVARRLARRAILPPLTLVLLQRMVSKYVKAAEPLPPVGEPAKKRAR